MTEPADRARAAAHAALSPGSIPGSIPGDLISPAAIERIARSLTDYLGAHIPVVDDSGEVVDALLIWWNPAYERIRVVPVEYRQSMMATYYDPHVALGHLRRALRDGVAEQLFVLEAGTVDTYRTPDELVDIRVTWLRVGDLVVEVGSDNSQVTSLEQRLDDQEREATAAMQEHLRALERQRIGRRLHDSAIQRLFATSLDLQRLAPSLGGESPHDRTVVDAAIETIDAVITDIRRTVFDIVPDGE